jgi:alpha-L-fucosidase
VGLLGLAGVVGVVTALAVSVAGAPAARADLLDPRQTWLRNSTSGLFLHWGMRTSPGFTSCTAWENAVNSGGWSADYWVNEAKKLHASYIVLATFHSRLGYARPYPSAIPGTCAPKTDYLGKLIDAGKKQNVKVIMYVTDDPQHHNETGFEYLNSAAYSAHVGHHVDLRTRDGFGQFSMEVFVEAMKRYPDLAGFWIDNDNAVWERNNLYAKIHQQRPDMVLSNNNEDTPDMDTVSNEQKTGMSPGYDYPQAVWTAQPRLTEADYKLPDSGAWWFSGGNSAVNRKLNIGRLVANGYLGAIWESIGGCEGGGFMYGGMPGGFRNDGAHGATTIRRDNPNVQYIHVVTRPSANVLRRPPARCRATGVRSS